MTHKWPTSDPQVAQKLHSSDPNVARKIINSALLRLNMFEPNELSFFSGKNNGFQFFIGKKVLLQEKYEP